MVQVEDNLPTYFSPALSSSLKPPTLPTKPFRVTSNLGGKAYVAAGRAGACLHNMGILQAYQTDLLGLIKQDEPLEFDLLNEIRRAADLSLQATKETAPAIGPLWQQSIICG